MINTGEIANLLRPGLKTVFGESPAYPPASIYRNLQDL